jgi:hypothetical protein
MKLKRFNESLFILFAAAMGTAFFGLFTLLIIDFFTQ